MPPNFAIGKVTERLGDSQIEIVATSGIVIARHCVVDTGAQVRDQSQSHVVAMAGSAGSLGQWRHTASA
ncbi:hypothetical protein M0655_19745 [Gordonia amicalis]|uniref:Uncharacterized protein n=1 Tax=Gordonia amicalis TaxID=89053 RepID=A0AAE4R7L4_9ACTN|nr:hypothetical protein [Gordonia amicalis]MDV6314519.1 hypothetical protein [Gordonia amicalis]UPW13463.1 hypothetical protein M0655_19745 [Gordonia amicalis]